VIDTTKPIVAAAVATPLTASGTVDSAQLSTHTLALLDRGLTDLTLFGTTGEGSSIATHERIMALETCIASGISPQQLGMGVFALSVEDAVEQASLLVAHDCGHILLAPPCYFKHVDDDGLFTWFSKVIEKSLSAQTASAAMPQFFLYHIPSFTAVPLSLSLIHRLGAQFPQVIAGVKDSSGDWGYTEKLLAERSQLRILIGHEGDLARGIRHGASGTISGMSNMIPEAIGKIVNSGEDDERVLGIIRELVKYPVIPALKALMAHTYNSNAWARVKPPLSALKAADAASLGKTMDSLFGKT
jgi:4-hydroxy-tetrahydrodipicolinate synthase